MINLYELNENDSEFSKRLKYFVEEEIEKNEELSLDAETRNLAVISVLIATQSIDMYKEYVKEVVVDKINPVMIKEIVYQAVDYLGLGKVYPFLYATNEVFEECKITLPLQNQETTTLNDRLEKGVEKQVAIFGDHMKEAWKSSQIGYFLASNCFGDYYTRNGLDLAQRELITFCFLMAQGGCEPQLIAHATGNMNLGNDRVFLMKVVFQCLPYIGYPRSLNAITCINQSVKK